MTNYISFDISGRSPLTSGEGLRLELLGTSKTLPALVLRCIVVHVIFMLGLGLGL